MADRDVRQAILEYLDGLPKGETVQPAKISDDLGIPPDQVNAFLAAKRVGKSENKAEVEVAADGSVKIDDRLRGQFSAGTLRAKKVKAPPVPGSGGAFAVLNSAIEKVPAVRYALGVAGIAASVAIIKESQTDLRVAVFGSVVMLALMALLFLFAKLTSVAARDIRVVMLTFLWFSLILWIATGSLLFTSVFFSWPINLTQWITGRETSPPPGTRGEASSIPSPSSIHVNNAGATVGRDLVTNVNPPADTARMESILERGLPQDEHPVIDLAMPIEEQLQLFPEDKVKVVVGTEEIKEVWFGRIWEPFEQGRTYTAWGIQGQSIVPKFRGSGEIKLEISYTRHRDIKRNKRVYEDDMIPLP